MPYVAELEPGEQLFTQVWFASSRKSDPFSLAVSDRALFLPRQKFFAVKDDKFFERIPLSRIRAVARVRLSPYVWWAFAVLLVVTGLITTVLMMAPILAGKGGKVSGYPPALIVVGAVIPFAVRKRHGVEVRMVDGTFRWNPPLVVDSRSKVRIREAQDEILAACKKAGIQVISAE